MVGTDNNAKRDRDNIIIFLQRKDVQVNSDRYVHGTMYAMALALFSSIVVGVIFRTIGSEMAALFGETPIFKGIYTIGEYTGNMTGVAVGVAVAWVLRAPLLVIASAAAIGQMGAMFTGFGIDVPGGPFGALLAAVVGTEFGKLIYKETRLDFVFTPAVTLLTGGIVAKFTGPLVGWILITMGKGMKEILTWNPFVSSILVAVFMGMFLTLPIISSAAFAIMIELSGVSAGAAVAGCCAQMIGFAVCSFKSSGMPGLLAQGIGTSMLQMSNIIRKPIIWLPPTIAAAIMGPVSTCVFHMTNNKMGAGMGTSGLVGQLSAFAEMGYTGEVAIKVLLVHIIMPAVITYGVYKIMVARKLVTPEDYKI